VLGATAGIAGPIAWGAGYLLAHRWWEGTLTGAKVRTADGRVRIVPGGRLFDACLAYPDARASEGSDWGLWVHFTEGWDLVTGSDAARITARLVRRMNHAGGNRSRVREALNLIRLEGHPEDFLRTLLRERAIGADLPERIVVYGAGGREVKERTLMNWLGTRKAFTGSIGLLRPAEGLAFEMAFSEERERRAMEGELRLLEEAWREAEEIAAIADGLFEREGARKSVTAPRE
jgi:hypothetical protein